MKIQNEQEKKWFESKCVLNRKNFIRKSIFFIRKQIILIKTKEGNGCKLNFCEKELVINRRIFDDTKAIGVAASPGNSYRHFYWKFQKQDKVFRWNCGRLMLTCYLTRGYSLKGFKLHAHVGVLKSTIFIDLLIEMLNKYNFFIQIQSSMFDSYSS